MAKGRFVLLVMAAGGGLLLAGCQCDNGISRALNDNLSGAELKQTLDWFAADTKRAVEDLRTDVEVLACKTEHDCWLSPGTTDYSMFEDALSGEDLKETLVWLYVHSNITGEDWRENVLGCESDQDDPPPPPR